MSLMGVDVGTTGVKAVAFDERGRLLASAYEEYPLLFPFPGANELDSQGVVDAALRVMAAAASEVADADPVVAIGVASQGEAFTPVDEGDRIIGNAMTSSDVRSEPFVTSWCTELGRDHLYEITGHTAYPMYSLFKFAWLKQHRPDVWKRARRFLFFEDLIGYVLTGEAKTDYSMATRSMLFDVKGKVWSDEILGRLDLAPVRLPEPIPSGTIVGTVRPALVEKLRLGKGAKIVAGGHDQPVGALGCGAAASGTASYAIGTVECICPAIDHLILSPELMSGNLATYPHVISDTYTTVAFNLTGGSALRWLRDNFAIEEANEARARGEDPYDHIIRAAATEPAKVILLPHFGPTGTPHFDPNGTGVLFGLTQSTTRAEILRAFLEGITFEMRWNLSILGDAGFALSELRAIGGGAKSDTWMQIKADILGVPLLKMQVTEATCMGAAILAGCGLRLFDAREASTRWAVPVKTFTPSHEHDQAYSDRFAVYRELYTSLAKARQVYAAPGGRSSR